MYKAVQRSFEPTYKELKPVYGGREEALGRSFEPTYKELKQEKYQPVQFPVNRF